MATLYIVGTPIGNLEDITLRALRTLKEVDFVLCEDTRVTKKLLSHYEINKPCIAYHQHSDERKIEEIRELLNQGKNLALVTDAGTPGISDPGNQLISLLVDQFKNSRTDKLTITPIPGPCALTAALSISGLPTDHFVFMGFPPHKKHRKQFFEKVAACQETVAFYESPYRIIKTLTELSLILDCHSERSEESLEVTLRDPSSPEAPQDDKKERQLIVCRELTKMFETVHRGTVEEVLEQLKSDTIKGEFIVVVSAI